MIHVENIDNVLEISHSTLYRHLNEGVLYHTAFTGITDADLDQKVTTVRTVHPNNG